VPSTPESPLGAASPSTLEPPASWEHIYEDNVVPLYRLMYSRVGNRPDAEDLTSEVFSAALRPLRTAASRSEVRAYIRVTARSVLARYWHRRFSTEITTIDETTATGFLDEPPSESELERRAHEALATLPERYHTILELRFFQQLSIKEAAATMGVSVANAKVLQHRGLRVLKTSGIYTSGGEYTSMIPSPSR
jgi:RNA polymerase sigma factor (sigma-70 family)